VIQNGQVGETYIIGGGNQKPNLEIVTLICEILDELHPAPHGRSYADQISFVKDRQGHDWRYGIDFSKIRAELNWQPQESLESGLRKTVEWYLENQAWIQAIQSNRSYQDWLEINYQEREKPE
jgi:dTDP-glucose 4,6-dehydratase